MGPSTKKKYANTVPRALAIFEQASKFVVIDEPKVEIIKLLTEGVSIKVLCCMVLEVEYLLTKSIKTWMFL